MNADAESVTKANRDRALENAILEIGTSTTKIKEGVIAHVLDGLI